MQVTYTQNCASHIDTNNTNILCRTSCLHFDDIILMVLPSALEIYVTNPLEFTVKQQDFD